MRIGIAGGTLALFVVATGAQAQAGAAQGRGPVLTKEQQLAVAVKAAPEDMRAGATVLGYENGKLVTLREGAHDMICTADDPSQEGFEVSCYHESVEPYIARGRQLREQGVTGQAVNQVRFREMDEKKLPLPVAGAVQYILTGAYDPASGDLTGSYLRWVVYTPYATPQTTGLSTRGAASAPWLMGAGTAGAHIMITPPRNPGG
jgi:hypothetical protein